MLLFPLLSPVSFCSLICATLPYYFPSFLYLISLSVSFQLLRLFDFIGVSSLLACPFCSSECLEHSPLFFTRFLCVHFLIPFLSFPPGPPPLPVISPVYFSSFIIALVLLCPACQTLSCVFSFSTSVRLFL